jgi:hypothetical protein
MEYGIWNVGAASAAIASLPRPVTGIAGSRTKKRAGESATHTAHQGNAFSSAQTVRLRLAYNALQSIIPRAKLAIFGFVLLQHPETRTYGLERNIEDDHDGHTLFSGK